MERGDVVYLKRPKRFMAATVVSAYDFPAVRVRMKGRNEELIVGLNEIVTDQKRQEAEIVTDQKRQEARLLKECVEAKSRYAGILADWEPGMSWDKWMLKTGKWEAFGQVKKLKRLRLIS